MSLSVSCIGIGADGGINVGRRSATLASPWPNTASNDVQHARDALLPAVLNIDTACSAYR